MTTRVAINGFGRIGRQVIKAVYERYWDSIEIVAVGSHGLIVRSGIGWRLRSAGIAPSNEPSAADTNEFWPIATGRKRV